jgi:hypothetical protein
MLLHDIYQFAINTIGRRSSTEMGERVVLSSEDAPIRSTLPQQQSPDEYMRYTYDEDAQAKRLYVQNDFSVGDNVYCSNSEILFSTSPALSLLVDPTTCLLQLKSDDTVLQQWGLGTTWTQTNGDDAVSSNGFTFGDYAVWLFGYLETNEFGIFRKPSLFGDYGIVGGYVFTNVTTRSGVADDYDHYIGRGALFMGADNNYRFAVDRTGHLCLWQRLSTGMYQLLERF